MNNRMKSRQVTPRRGPLSLLFAMLLAVARAAAAPGDVSPSDLVAVMTDLPQPVVIAHCEITLRTELSHNALDLQAVCKLQNRSGRLLDQVDFDLLAAEQFYGAKVAVTGVAVLQDGKRAACQFRHQSLERPTDPAQEGTREFPKILRVTFPSPLAAAAECLVVFEYRITIPDPTKEMNYRLIAALPTGEKEACLLTDFSWIPRPASDFAEFLSLSQRNFFPRYIAPTWQFTVTHPAALQSLVPDGRLEETNRVDGNVVARYTSIVRSLPQILIGPCERIEVPGRGVAVTFLLPKGKYKREEIENSARFFQRVYEFYHGLFGPLAGKPIQVAVSSAGMGGHGAFLGTFLDELPARESGAFDETAAHELAHSWWGYSVASYGRGTKLLREALCNYGAWELGRTEFQTDRFYDEIVRLLFSGALARPLFRAMDDSEGGAYTKGALVMHLLRQEMGDETFLAVLRAFASRFRDGDASFADFVAVCNEVSRRDWLPFLSHWCYGTGLPAYRVVAHESCSASNGWRTTVTLTNAGQGIVTCPVELQTTAGPQRQRVAVPENQARVWVWQTPGQVTNVVVDPDHSALQGDAEEIRLKLLAVPDSALLGNWECYWKGTLHGDAGDNARAEALISRAIDMFKGPMPTIALHAYYYSRGVVRLRAGQAAKGAEDLGLFLEGVLQPHRDQPASADRVVTELADLPRLLTAGTPQGRREQLYALLCQITGADVPIDPELAGWRKWWTAQRSTFQPGSAACRLSPSGMPQNEP